MHTKRNRQKGYTASSLISMGVLAVLCVTGSFAVGVQTAGDVQTIAPTEAHEEGLPGDMNSDRVVNAEDIAIILEIAKGYRDPLPAMLRNDPNGDGRLDLDDALRLLHDIHTL